MPSFMDITDRNENSPSKTSCNKIPNHLNSLHSKKHRIVETIGCGVFAKCYKMRSIAGNKFYALKVIDLKKTTEKQQLQKLLKSIKSEIMIQRSIKHPHIVRYRSHKKKPLRITILLEYCDSGTLGQFIKKHERLNERQCAFYLKQILSAVHHLHEMNVIHRDIKVDNMFLTGDSQTLKVGDFGFATVSNGELITNGICGTPNYIAPEILLHRKYSTKSDMWAIGCCFYLMLFGVAPFHTKSIETTYEKIKSGVFDFPPNVRISSGAKDLVRSLLHFDPQTRFSCLQVLNHPFMKHYTGG